MKMSLFKILGTFFLILSLFVGLYLVQKAVLYFSGASGTNANLIIDLTTEYGKISDTWRNLAQGGEDKNRMLLPVIPQIKSLQPEYVRIDHVFDYYNLAELDNMIHDIQAMGAKPFISLSYMPTDIAKNQDVTSLPVNWADWEFRVQKLIEHVSGKNGLAIDNVYYEVWNEPDLFGSFKLKGTKSYLDLYLHTAHGASRAVNTLPYKFGGPAVTAFYPNWIAGLIDYTTKNNLRLDFVSWHKYSKNLGDYDLDATGIRELLAKYGKGDLETVISEMGPNSSNDPVYDNNFGAIHEIAVNTVLEGAITKVFTFEIKDGAGASKYWGRWGLFTNEKFGTPLAKPRANAIFFLNKMLGGSKLNVFGQGSWVKGFAKKNSPTSMKILIVNYDQNANHNEVVPIKLVNLPFSNFIFKKVDFLGESVIQEVSTSSAEWATTVYFRPNTASIFEITAK